MLLSVAACARGHTTIKTPAKQGRPLHAIAFIQKGHCIFCCLLWLPWYTLPLYTGMWQQALPATRATQKAGLCLLLSYAKGRLVHIIAFEQIRKLPN